MDKQTFQELPHKAIEAVSVVIVQIAYCAPGLELTPFPGNTVTETGLLEVGKLASPEAEFRLRWDEKAESIDVDPWLLEAWSRNFSGHHTEKLTDAPNRTYAFDIEMDNKPIFKGILEVSIKTSNRMSKPMSYAIRLPQPE